MFVPGLIERKRDGGELTAGEWRDLMIGYHEGQVPDYQMSALLMAAFFRGLSAEETSALLDGMMASGIGLKFGDRSRAVVDKHSTGGVGDKVSLVLAPVVASLSVLVPMMSGRGLGHTGGTLDKLESIPGFRTDLSIDQVQAQLERIGCAMFGQTPEIAPVDRRLYALRDVTATVESIPLIAASIMSKKLAEGLTGLVLDVKQGSGAFITASSLDLARTMMALGEARGCPTVALLTAMDRPLGRACGNALETEEAIMALRGEGPQDLHDVTLALGVEMLLLAGETDRARAAERLEAGIRSGRAAETFQQIIEAQGGDPRCVDDPALLPQAAAVEVYYARAAGTILEVEPRTIGRAVVQMGGGRQRVEDAVDPTVGFVITARPGQTVHTSEPLASIFARDGAGIELGRQALDRAIKIGEGSAAPLPLVAARVSAKGVEKLA
ncbi:MAG: thymidine phosphorylase [Gemmatimonadetes bacterium]|nr:thymidine phosphorylase [Gemmatimonadota bacterium]